MLSSRMLTRVTFGAFAATVAASFLMEPRALAYKRFAEKEGVTCNYCHVRPGGPRNYRGKFYKKNMLTFATFDDAAAAYSAGEAEPLPTKEVPKSLTAPGPVTDAYAKAATAKATLDAKAGDPALTKAFGDAEENLAKTILGAKDIPDEARFTAALKAADTALAADPKNTAAAKDKKAAEDGLKAVQAAKEKAEKEKAAAAGGNTAPAATP